MADKITYYDLSLEAKADRLPAAIGRTPDMDRLSRVLERRLASNALVIAPSGAGKTAFLYGWARRYLARGGKLPIFQLDAEHLANLCDQSFDDRYLESLLHLPESVVCIDDFGRAIHGAPDVLARVLRIYRRTMSERSVHFVLATEPETHRWIERESPQFLQLFEALTIKPQSTAEHARIVRKALPRVNTDRVIVPDKAVQEIVSLAERFPILGQIPRSSIQLLDQSLSLCAARGERMLSIDMIAEAAEGKTGVPRAQLSKNELESLKDLDKKMHSRVVSQKAAIEKIATTLQRAKLGLRNPNRPFGSFLLLGPSGVGKTETAKSVAEILFGSEGSFIRLDMSEFQQDHTVQRLIGAPAGYVGFEEGGALTNALRKNPYSLVLLDEIEKAHPKIFDLFLQVLDDGRLTSGGNETVDARNAVIMATSNAAVSEILAAYEKGVDIHSSVFLKERIMPVLAQTFRLEFLNRFDSILIFQPLSESALLQIAGLEIKKVESRLSKHRVRFSIEEKAIKDRIAQLADPRFGARPVKRFIEETCETLLVHSLLGTKL